MAYTSTPTTNDSCLIQSTWYTSAAAPETNSNRAGISSAGDATGWGVEMAEVLLATREDMGYCLVQNFEFNTPPCRSWLASEGGLPVKVER
ncbi:hypothetical protein D3C86_1878470 [compost metagenome]